MELLVAAASEPSGQSVRLIVLLLLAVAFGLSCLTVWYWRFTSPRRHSAIASEQPTSGDAETTGTHISPDPPAAPPTVPAGLAMIAAVTGQLPANSLPLLRPESDDQQMAVLDPVDEQFEGSGPPIDQADPLDAIVDQVIVDQVILDQVEDSGDDIEDSDDRDGVPVDLEFSILSEAAKTGEINLTDDQWEHLADAVLGAIGWGSLDGGQITDDMTSDVGDGISDDGGDEILQDMADRPLPDRPQSPSGSDASRSVGALD